MSQEPSYVVAGSRPWNRRTFEGVSRLVPGRWHYVGTKDELTPELLAELQPRYVFFLHWSWKVPSEILESHECVNFHMTDLPYGRGGSPLQNLVLAGHRETVLSALRMTDVLDAGPIYLKRPLPLHGTAEEIYARSSALAGEMIEVLVRDRPRPVPQRGEVVEFARRKPAQSELPTDLDLEGALDFIRMLDADGYPHAFVRVGRLRLELGRAVAYSDSVRADVTITIEEDEP